MKMSDIFELPVSPEPDAIWYGYIENGTTHADFERATAHAINCHDDLVAALEEIVAACEQRGEANDPDKFWEASSRHRKALQKARAALAKARVEG